MSLDLPISKRAELEKESSMCYWYPKITDLHGITPKTQILELTPVQHKALYNMLDGKKLPVPLEYRIKIILEKFSEPLFLRTDQASGKHEWKDTCFVDKKEDIFRHIANLIEWHECAGIIGLRFDALVFREYLPLQSQFTAFMGMPVAPEWRFFVRDGKVDCYHPYWPKESIVRPSVEDWQTRLQAMQKLSSEDEKLLTAYAERFSKSVPGYWSVDFALSRDRGWILIDAARGELSWHPEDCPRCPEYCKPQKNTVDESDIEGMLVLKAKDK